MPFSFSLLNTKMSTKKSQYPNITPDIRLIANLLKVIAGVLAACILWAFFAFNAQAGPLDFLDMSAKIDRAENLLYMAAGIIGTLAVVWVLRSVAIIISRHWKLVVALSAIALALGGILL